jgi:hypothetical protein
LVKSVHVFRSVEICRTPVPNHRNLTFWGVWLKLMRNGETVTAVMLKEGTWEAVSWKAVGALDKDTPSGMM